MSRKRILVVDDELLISLDIEATLEEHGHDVSIAATSAEAEAVLEAHRMDLVILDHHLKGGTSDAVAERLKQMGVPFVVCSGSTELDELGGVFAGARFLPKPYTTEALLAVVADAVPDPVG